MAQRTRRRGRAFRASASGLSSRPAGRQPSAPAADSALIIGLADIAGTVAASVMPPLLVESADARRRRTGRRSDGTCGSSCGEAPRAPRGRSDARTWEAVGDTLDRGLETARTSTPLGRRTENRRRRWRSSTQPSKPSARRSRRSEGLDERLSSERARDTRRAARPLGLGAQKGQRRTLSSTPTVCARHFLRRLRRSSEPPSRRRRWTLQSHKDSDGHPRRTSAPGLLAGPLSAVARHSDVEGAPSSMNGTTASTARRNRGQRSRIDASRADGRGSTTASTMGLASSCCIGTRQAPADRLERRCAR